MPPLFPLQDYVQNLSDDESFARDYTSLITTVDLVVFVLVLGVRCLCQCHLKGHFTKLDFGTAICSLLVFCLPSLVYTQVTQGLGAHESSLSGETIFRFRQTLFAYESLWIFINSWTKICLLAALHRLFRSNRNYQYRYLGTVISLLAIPINWMLLWMQCGAHLSSFYDFQVGTCRINTGMYLGATIVDLVINAVILAMLWTAIKQKQPHRLTKRYFAHYVFPFSLVFIIVGSNALYGKQVTDRIVMADLTFTSFGFVAWSVTQVVLVQAFAIVLSTIAAKNELLAMGLTLANNNCPGAQNVTLGTTPSQATPSQTTASQNTAPGTHPESSSVPAITVTSPEPSTTPPPRQWSTGAVELSTLSPLGREILRPPQKPFAVAESTDDSFVGSSKTTHPNAHSSSPVYPNFSTLSPCTSQSSLSSSTVFEEWRHSPKPISPRQPPGWARPGEPQPVKTYLSPDEWVCGRSLAPPRANPEPDPKSPPRAPPTEPPLEQVTSRSRVRDSYGSIDIVRTVVCTYESASSTAAQEMRAELVNPFDAAFATPGSGRRSYEVTITGGGQNRVPTRDLTGGTRDNESV